MGMQNSKYLVAGYPFENTANDIKGVNNGTVFGAAYVDGKIGRALSFDGVDDYVDLNNNVYVPSSVNFAISFRVNQSLGTIPTYGGLFSLRSRSDSSSPYNLICILSTDATYGLAVGNGLGAKATTLPARGVYNHIFILSENNVLSIYVNAIKQITNNVGFAALSNNNWIGKYTTNTASSYFKGIVNDFKIYNFPASRIITRADIQRDYLNLPIL